MREDIFSDNRVKACKTNGNGNPPKPKSAASWGSQLVKGFTSDKKTKLQISIPNKKAPLACPEVPTQKNQYISYHSRVKRSLMGDFPCSTNVAQVHPQALDCHRIMSPSSRDLFFELDNLRSLLREAKERELVQQAELMQYKENPRVEELERELDIKRTEVENLISRLGSIEAEKTSLAEQLATLTLISECCEENSRWEECESKAVDSSVERTSAYKHIEMEVVELRRLNKELQFQKRNLAFRLSSAESQLAALAKVTESETLAKVKAEATVLRHTNKDLCKQVEGLQMSRLNEVEELAYLRWENSCLRQELYSSDRLCRQNAELDNDLSFTLDSVNTIGNNDAANQNLQCLSKSPSDQVCDGKEGGNMRKEIKWPPNDEVCQNLQCQTLFSKEWIEAQEGRSPRRRHSISGPKGVVCVEDLKLNKRRQSDAFISSAELEDSASAVSKSLEIKDKHNLISHHVDLGDVQSPRFSTSKQEHCRTAALDVEKRALRIPNPPPRPSISVSDVAKVNGPAALPPPPPPPPPPPKFPNRSTGVMQRAPQVAELYHSLMKRDSRKEASSGGICDAPNVASVRSSMIGEIENRSSHLLAIKADIETQGEFVRSLIKEVNNAAYQDIEDVVAFVKWLDDELCFLVDERAVLKHFDWPEKKADTMREAAFGYRDLKRLEYEVSSYEDDPRLTCDVALKKMVALSEKVERSIYNLLRTRDVMIRHCKEFQIPTDWMLDTGIISKVKFASVKLAKKYMKRVAMELQARGQSEKDPALEYMLLQGVRFAFRIHQFAGGFDAETMHVFEELRNLAHVRNKIQRELDK